MKEKTPAESPFPEKLVHLGIVVRDIDKTVKRLESLGIGPFGALSMAPPIGKIYYRGKPLDAEYKVLSTKIGEVELEMFEPVKGESPWQEFLDNKGEGIHHMALLVDDLDKETDRLTERGASIMLQARSERGGGAYLDLNIGGIIIELLKD